VLAKIYKPADTLLGRVPGLAGYNDLSMSPEAKPLPGVVLYRFEGPLLFFNADYFKARVMELIETTTPRPRWFVLSLEAMTQLDTTGASAIEEINSLLRERDVQLVIARPKLYMRKYSEPLRMGEKIGRENIFISLQDAVAAILKRDAERGEVTPSP
jgi:MFS superfamily sulfate permease-like transporter